MIADKLKKLRKEKKLSMRELGDMLNMSYANVSIWESGIRTPSLETLTKLAKILEVPIGYFIEDEKSLLIEPTPIQQQSIQQKNCIDEITSLSDIECMQVLTFIKTMKQVKKEADLETLRILKLNDNN